jgi:hypothetical protein
MHMHENPRTIARLSLAGLLLGPLLSGCSAFGYRPVMPYEREALTSPLIAVSRDPISDKYLQHVFETREGARGATGTTGSGCGCN